MNYIARFIMAIATSTLITAGGYAFAIIPDLLMSDMAKQYPNVEIMIKIFCAGLVAVIAFCITISSLKLAKGGSFWILAASVFCAFCVALPIASKVLFPGTMYIFKVVATAQFSLCVIAGFVIIFRDELTAAMNKKS